MMISTILRSLVKFTLRALAKEAAVELGKSLKAEKKAVALEGKVKEHREKAKVNVKNADRVNTIVKKLKEVDL